VTRRFTEELRRLAEPVWEAQHQHPFVRAIGDGTVDRKQFEYWVRQDYLYLIEYARLFALAVARAPDLETMTKFAELTQMTLATEMSLHRSYAARFGISEKQLESEAKSPTTQAYTDFLLRTACLGDFGELIAALSPCMWGFSEIGLRLKAHGLPDDPLCAEWVEMYASPEFAELAEWCRGLLDRIAEGLPETRLEALRDAFLTSSRYELRFWDMAYRLEAWEQT
jgi:thiaminase/transcriptional activator TenA